MEKERRTERHEFDTAEYGYVLAECERVDGGYRVLLYASEGYNYDTGRMDYACEPEEELWVGDGELDCGDIAEFLENELPSVFQAERRGACAG